jgi:hypothetical protein
MHMHMLAGQIPVARRRQAGWNLGVARFLLHMKCSMYACVICCFVTAASDLGICRGENLKHRKSKQQQADTKYNTYSILLAAEAPGVSKNDLKS